MGFKSFKPKKFHKRSCRTYCFSFSPGTYFRIYPVMYRSVKLENLFIAFYIKNNSGIHSIEFCPQLFRQGKTGEIYFSFTTHLSVLYCYRCVAFAGRKIYLESEKSAVAYSFLFKRFPFTRDASVLLLNDFCNAARCFSWCISLPKKSIILLAASFSAVRFTSGP